MLVELSVMEQRYQAVLAVVQDGWKVVEVADRLGVSRQSVHNWIARYEQGGLAALTDRSHRPDTCPHSIGRTPRAGACDPRRRDRRGVRPGLRGRQGPLGVLYRAAHELDGDLEDETLAGKREGDLGELFGSTGRHGAWPSVRACGDALASRPCG